MMPTDWLDPEAPDTFWLDPEKADRYDDTEHIDLYCDDCGYLESDHIEGRCPTESEVRERWGK